jgi:uncharacterized membrane protein YccC
LNLALLRVVGTAQSAEEQLDYFRRSDRSVGGSIDDALARAVSALKQWQWAAIDAAGLDRKFREAEAQRHLGEMLFPVPSGYDAARRRAAAVSAMCELLAALTAYAEAYETCLSGASPDPAPPPFSRANDPVTALWTGLRAALAVILVGSFWILTAWPHGSTAVILAAVATARVATMGRAVPLALAASMIFVLMTLPAFVIIDVLLPLASGFPIFALIVGPFLFCCAFLMGQPNPKAMLIGFLSALLFASLGQFQNRMIYDPVGLLNTSIAAAFAAGVTFGLWAVVAPETAEAARRRFLRIARQAVSRLTAPRHRFDIAAFEARIAEGLDQLHGHLRADQPGDIAALQAGMRLLGAGQALLRRQETDRTPPTVALGNSSIPDSYVVGLLERRRAGVLARPSQPVIRHAA